MKTKITRQKQELVDRVCEHIQLKMPQKKAAMIQKFAQGFFANMPPRDLTLHTVESLYGMAVSFWNFGDHKSPNEAKIRVYNPTIEDFGWNSPHTMVEIISEDQVFLVDSITQALTSNDYTVFLTTHPVFMVERDQAGKITHLDEQNAEIGQAESFIQLQINEQSDPNSFKNIQKQLQDVLRDLNLAVNDWAAMRTEISTALEEMEKNPPPLPIEEREEARAMLTWMRDDNFTFLGYIEYRTITGSNDTILEVIPNTNLGLLRITKRHIFGERAHPDKSLLMINKTNLKSTVHRAVHMDALFLKIFDAAGIPCGEKIFCGLFTSAAYSGQARFIPVLRQKLQAITDRSGYKPNSHDAKRLGHILETLPRDELFQGSIDELFNISMGILNLQERHRTALFVRHDSFERFVSCLIYTPRDGFDTALRHRMQKILEEFYQGPVTASYISLTDDVLSRLHMVVRTTPGTLADRDSAEVEAKIVAVARSWTNHLQDALFGAMGEGRGLSLLRRYRNAFSTAYKETYSAQEAVRDIIEIEQVIQTGQLGIYLSQPLEAEPHEAKLKFTSVGSSLPLSDVLPIIEHMGFRALAEIPTEIHPLTSDNETQSEVWCHEFLIHSADNRPINVAEVRHQIEDTVARVWTGEMEDDNFNRLVLIPGLTWRSVVIIRAYAKYLRQAAFTISQDYISDALARHQTVTRDLIALFSNRFDPDYAFADQRAQKAAGLHEQIEAALDKIENLDDDRILRRYLNLIDSTLRTNFYQPDADGNIKSYLSLKINSQQIDELPKPRPMVEIFVYSPRVEAVHLRGGIVARGGLRWSDRREDFRTEILGLVKAQMVKNAVIVPLGSKGGFYVKRPPTRGGREAFLAEGIECYKIFMKGMLDITDNLHGHTILPPPSVIRHDQDDPYLVVAADKGTATFSDIANSISQDYGFWLDDAFASGGSVGYDHKKMGITARGAWESVKRHFREMGHDTQREKFTCIGVGDMSGDVFGNGMLLSEHICLLAAFNHQHIFIDPNPDNLKNSWVERKRIFDLPRSSWADYNRDLLSTGGGIFERKAKTIEISTEMRERFDITAKRLTPTALIQALLTASVDLLWFGGIGTYIKAGDETNADVGDRATDAIRVSGKDVRAKVIGEGANLGVTQYGRIEYAHNGGCINTDAVDNSAGVDCSDHEVNIKILLGMVVQSGDITTKQRNELLETMTDEVADLVLRDNYLQTLALSMMQRLGTRHMDPAQRFIRRLERSGRLDRANEFLPDDETIIERRSTRRGLTRPEISVLLAYSKMEIYELILASELPDEPLLVGDLLAYFPIILQKRFADEIKTHRLRREIIATVVTNALVNRTGPTFVSELERRTGRKAAEIARAFTIVRDVFNLEVLWQEIEALDNKIPSELQYEMMFEVERLVDRVTLWFLRNGHHPLDISENVATYKPGLTALSKALPDLISLENQHVVDRRCKKFRTKGVSESLSRQVGQLTQLSPGCDIVRIAHRADWPVEQVGGIYFALGARFGFDWLRWAASDVPMESHWHDMAVSAIIDDSVVVQIELVQKILAAAKKKEQDQDLLENWIENHAEAARHVEDMLHEMKTVGSADVAMLAVANRELRILLID